jgi:hypothetical protein
MKKLHEHYRGAVEQTVAGLIQLAAEEACVADLHYQLTCYWQILQNKMKER